MSSSQPSGRRARWQPDLLRMRRQAANLSLDAASEQLRQAAIRLKLAEPGITPSLMSRHENGQNYPGKIYRRLYCEAYGATEPELGFRPCLPADKSNSVAESHSDKLSPTGAQCIASEIKLASQRAMSFSKISGATVSSPETIEQLYDEVVRLTVLFPQKSAREIVTEICAVQAIIFDLMGIRRRPAELIELLMIAAIVSSILANAIEDLGDLKFASVHARTAFQCADDAGHPALCAWAKYLQAKYAYWGNDLSKSILLVEQAKHFASMTRGTVVPAIYALEGRARAAYNDVDGARIALRRANEAREAVVMNDLDHIGGDLYFPRARQLYYAADTELLLPGGASAGATAASEAIREYEAAPSAQRSFLNEAHSRFCLAYAHGISGELDGARVALRPILDLPPAMRADGLKKSLLRLEQALKAPCYRECSSAEDFRLEIAEFCLEGAAR